MGIDRQEASMRGHQHKRKTKHPYAAIQHRVIDSEAYADLTFSARSLLTLIVRQLTKDNNGRLQATFSYMRRFGIDSERTLARGIAELISHGFIYRTRSGGYQQGAALYAVTWEKIQTSDGLYLDGFVPCAWRHWTPSEKKSPPAKMQGTHGKNGSRTLATPVKNAGDSPRKKAEYELVPCSDAETSGNTGKNRPHRPLTSPHCIRLVNNNDRAPLRQVA